MNQKVRKQSILATTVIVPVLLILFFTFATKNEYIRLETYYDLRNPDFDPAFLEAMDCSPHFKDSIHHIPPFQLINQDGQPVTEADLAGKVYVAHFFLTRCPNNVCSTTTSALVRVQELCKKYDDLRIVSYTIDPEFDTPERMKTYAQRYEADHNKWWFLTGQKDVIYNQAVCGYFVTLSSKEGSLDDHTDRFILVDKEGRIRGTNSKEGNARPSYRGTARDEVERLIAEIQILYKEYEQ
ncbi:MAG: SCO family protein [Bernardetiaceae bacterium]